MSTIETSLFTLITGLDTILGNRLYPSRLPQEPDMPSATYRMITNLEYMTHGGPTGLFKSRFQFDIYGSSFIEAKQAAEAVRQGINGFRGTVDTIKISSIHFSNEFHEFGEATEIYRVTVDYSVIHGVNDG